MPLCEASSLSGMTRSGSSDSLGFEVHFAPRGGVRRHPSAIHVNANGRSSHILEEDDDFTSHKALGRHNTFTVKNQNRYNSVLVFE